MYRDLIIPIKVMYRDLFLVFFTNLIFSITDNISHIFVREHNNTSAGLPKLKLLPKYKFE